MKTQTINPEEFFLDWWNDWLTVSAMASGYGISEKEANQLIEEGRSILNSKATKA